MIVQNLTVVGTTANSITVQWDNLTDTNKAQVVWSLVESGVIQYSVQLPVVTQSQGGFTKFTFTVPGSGVYGTQVAGVYTDSVGQYCHAVLTTIQPSS